MRQCRTCLENKPEEEYFYRGGGRKGLQADCKDCSRKVARKFRQVTRDKVGAYKMTKGCEVCGFKAEHPCQLDLDHIDPKTKTYKGSHKAYDAGWSWERVEKELAKCVVTCKNCHALRTYNEGHWENEHTSLRMRQSSAQS
jgi:hypothetical protein